jgi:hypothetical protein
MERRLDVVDPIGEAAEMTARRVGTGKSSEALELRFSTVRDWRQQLRQRAPDLLRELTRVPRSGRTDHVVPLPRHRRGALRAADASGGGQLVRELAAHTHELPDGSRKEFNRVTLDCWIHGYREFRLAPVGCRKSGHLDQA